MTEPRPSVGDKRRTFRSYLGRVLSFESWDVGARGFCKASASRRLPTSSGFAWSQGRPDGGISRDVALAHLNAIVAATDLPVNADFESGFATHAWR